MAEPATTLREQQFALAQHVRDPERNAPPPGIEERRLAIYRDLFFNSIEGLLAGNFPVIRQTLDDARWHALVREFYAGYRCTTPLFTEIGREFVRFLELRGEDPRAPWLHELAHYEWVELALQIAEDALPAHVADGDLLDGRPVVSPHAWTLAYRWPVQQIGPSFRPTAPPEAPTLLLVRRDVAGDVHFSQLSPLVYRLLALLDEGEHGCGRDLLRALAIEAGATDTDAFTQEGAAMLERLRAEGALLGVGLPG
jgi:uncharacterized protein